MYKKIAVFIAACMGMTFFGVTMITLGAVLPQISETFGLNQLEASELVVFLPIGILVGSLLFGPIVDRWGYKYLLILSSLIIALGLEGLAFLQHLAPFRLSIFFIGLGGGILNGLSNSLVSDITTDSDRGAKLSLLGTFYGIGALGVPVLLAFLSNLYPYQTILKGAGLMVILCVLYFVAINFPSAKQTQGFPLLSGIKLLKQPLLLLLSFVLFFQSAVEGLCNNWTTTYLGESASLTTEQALLALTCMVAGLTVARLLMSALFRTIGQKRLFLGSMFIAGSGSFLLYFTSSYTGALFAMALLGFGIASTFPVVFDILGTAFSSLSGTVFSIALVIALLGNTLINYLMGIMAKQWGIQIYPALMIISMFLMIMLFILSFRHKYRGATLPYER